MLSLAIFIFMLSVVIFPHQSLLGAKGAVDVCLGAVIPSLFPVFVLNNILIKSGAVTKFCNRYLKKISVIFNLPPSSAAAIILGIISGYPVGIKTAGDLYDEKHINFPEYKHLITFCSNAGPVFITGTVGTKIFNSEKVGVLLLTVHIITAIIVGILFRFILKRNPSGDLYKSSINLNKSLTALFTEGLETAVKTTAIVCGYIVFFGMVTAYMQSILKFLPKHTSAILTGFIEMTNGIFAISKTALPMNLKLSFVSGMLGWGGICVHAQSLSFLRYKKTYFAGKAMQGIMSFAITYIFLSFNLS